MNIEHHKLRLLDLEKTLSARIGQEADQGRGQFIDSAHDVGDASILSASMVGSKGLPAYSVYSATKAAVRSFARTWTTDLRERRIRVNAVSQGSIDTPPSPEFLASSEVGEKRKRMVAESVPLGRLGM